MRATATDQREAITHLQVASVRAVRALFPSAAAAARALGTTSAHLARWEQGAPIPDEARVRLAGMAAVILILGDVLAPETLHDWLHGINANLRDRRPVDLLARGAIADVLAAADAERTGAFA